MKVSKNKFARELSYKLIISTLPILDRFSNSTGITNVSELISYILGLSKDELLDYKFNDSTIVDSSEECDQI